MLFPQPRCRMFGSARSCAGACPKERTHHHNPIIARKRRTASGDLPRPPRMTPRMPHSGMAAFFWFISSTVFVDGALDEKGLQFVDLARRNLGFWICRRDEVENGESLRSGVDHLVVVDELVGMKRLLCEALRCLADVPRCEAPRHAQGEDVTAIPFAELAELWPRPKLLRVVVRNPGVRCCQSEIRPRPWSRRTTGASTECLARLRSARTTRETS